MSRSASQRKDAYKLKTVSSRIKIDFDNMKSTMEAEMNLVIDAQVALETATRGVLAGEAIISADYPFYMAFVKKLAAKQGTLTGGPVLKAFGDALNIYFNKVCGTATVTCKQLALQILGITLT